MSQLAKAIDFVVEVAEIALENALFKTSPEARKAADYLEILTGRVYKVCKHEGYDKTILYRIEK